MFAARASVLLETLKSDQVHSYLSGLLIGAEYREGTKDAVRHGLNITIVGETKLAEKYLIASQVLGFNAAQFSAEIALRAVRNLHRNIQ